MRGLVHGLLQVMIGVAAVTAVACGSPGDGGGGTGDESPSSPATVAREKTYTNADYGFSVTYDARRFEIFEEIAEGSGLIVLIADAGQTEGPAAVKISVGAEAAGAKVYEPGSGETMETLRAEFRGLKEDFAEADVGEPEECSLGGLPALCTYVGGTIPSLPIDDPQLTARLWGTRWSTKAMFVLAGTPSPIFGETEPALVEIVDSITIDQSAE